jgi:DNA modification methylase
MSNQKSNKITKKKITNNHDKAKSVKVKRSDSSLAVQTGAKKNETRVEIKPAKGRPMLTWVGKKPLRHAIAYPAQLVETFNAQPKKNSKPETEGGLLFHGDNKDVLAYLLANGYRGKVKLIYIDPPFDSGADYVRRVNLRGETVSVDGEGYSLGEQIQYSDIWTNDSYLQFMFERLLLIKELLSEDGSIFVHCDYRRAHYLRCLMDEVFSADNLRNHVVWQRIFAHNDPGQFGHNVDHILYYVKSSASIFNVQYIPYTQEYLDNFYKYIEPETGRRYRLVTMTSPHPRPNLMYEWKGYPYPEKGWRYTKDVMAQLDAEGRLHYPNDPKGRINQKYYLDEMPGAPAQELWTDINSLSALSDERMEYPTQKPEELIQRVISASTNPNDIVLDCFLGSGTTAAAAQKLGRRWIGADINKGAIQTTVKRLQGVMQKQAESAKGKTASLPGMEAEEAPAPAQLGFAVYRVNDYDLQIQHNEAFNLAVEHLGMTRSKTDAYFDGTLGKKLVKIVPFNHPVTPLDLEEVKRELNNRPDEERDIVVVGLGKEVAVNGWLEDWNKLRKQGNIPNKIEVIELRSDPKYGGFFTHEPTKAKVSFKRVKDSVEIAIEDFISPTILERLRQQNKDNPLFQPQVTDWRSMVDSVMIDSAYDGKVFNITLADVPEKKNDLVEGKYVLEVKKGASVAVKVTDMLGEEVLVVKEV